MDMCTISILSGQLSIWKHGKLTKLHQTRTNTDRTCWIWPNISKQFQTRTMVSQPQHNICVCWRMFAWCVMGFKTFTDDMHMALTCKLNKPRGQNSSTKITSHSKHFSINKLCQSDFHSEFVNITILLKERKQHLNWLMLTFTGRFFFLKKVFNLLCATAV